MTRPSASIDFDKLRAMEWDWTAQTNLVGPLALICPACSSHVPHGNDGSGTSYRERHIRFHEANSDRVAI